MTAETEDSRQGLLRIEKLILPFVDNVALFPVAFAVFGHVSILTAVAILAAVREGAIPAVAILSGLVVGTGWLIAREWKRRGRPGGISLILISTWAGAIFCAWAAARSGAF